MKIIKHEDIKNATQQERVKIMIDIINGKARMEEECQK